MSRFILAITLVLTLCIVSTFCISFPGLTSISRKWYVSGSFNKLISPDGTEVPLKGAAAYDSSGNGEWLNLGNLTNKINSEGSVSRIFVDSCSNTYIGGNFIVSEGSKKINGIARLKTGSSTWDEIPGISFVGTPIVKDISVDCFNVGDFSTGKCNCDVYLVGDFQAKIGEKIYHSFLRWDSNDNVVGDAGANFESGDVVVGVNKREFDSNIFSSSSRQIWTAGNRKNGVPFVRKGQRGVTGDSYDWEDIGTFTGTINAMHYRSVTTGSDQIYIAGNNLASGTRCYGVCRVERKGAGVEQVAGSSETLKDVNVLDVFSARNGDVYAGGSFKVPAIDGQRGAIDYLAISREGSRDWSTISSNQIGKISNPVKSLTICWAPDCAGTVFYALSDGSVGFITSDERYLPYNGAVNGTVTNVFTTVAAGAASISVGISALVSVVLAIVLMV